MAGGSEARLAPHTNIVTGSAQEVAPALAGLGAIGGAIPHGRDPARGRRQFLAGGQLVPPRPATCAISLVTRVACRRSVRWARRAACSGALHRLVVS